MDDQDIWKPNDDMITDLFHPPRDGLLQYTYVDFQPYLGDYPFEDSELLFDEDSQPSSCSILMDMRTWPTQNNQRSMP
jgi:hypothetical protein